MFHIKFLTDWITAFLSNISSLTCLFVWCSRPAALLKLSILPSMLLGSLKMTALESGYLKNLLPSGSASSRRTPRLILWIGPRSIWWGFIASNVCTVLRFPYSKRIFFSSFWVTLVSPSRCWKFTSWRLKLSAVGMAGLVDLVFFRVFSSLTSRMRLSITLLFLIVLCFTLANMLLTSSNGLTWVGVAPTTIKLSFKETISDYFLTT